jgi:cation diffusion facilitator CzcD-associated flavoprotein CzcO
MTGGQEKENRDLRIAIMGAGPGGICMGIQLKQAGFENFVLLEKADSVGGTWQHNTYPGCACDLPSLLYSFSFEAKLDWSRPYAPQPEILEYMEDCAKKYGILPHCRFQTEIKSAAWDEERACWLLTFGSGETFEADVVVSAIGMFNELAAPAIQGLDSFAGKVIHSARWDWQHSLAGETVAVIGSAASAVQLVPEIIKETGQVHLFQRTANWVMPKEDEPHTQEILDNLKTNPEAAAIMRGLIYKGVDEGMTFSDPVAVKEMEDAVLASMDVIEDPEIRAKLRPQHPFGCKRPLLSNVYFEAFNRPNLELVTEAIDRVTPNGVLTVDGKERVVDTLVLATGFSTTDYVSAIDLRGRNGLRIDDAWSDGAHAYLGITTSGFPNLFMLYGPNTNNGSILEMIEAQVEYAVRQIQRIAQEGLGWIDVRPEPMEQYNEDVQKAIQGVVPWQANCNGYYRSPSGRVVTQWPYSMSEFRKRTLEPDADAFETAPPPADD